MNKSQIIFHLRSHHMGRTMDLVGAFGLTVKYVPFFVNFHKEP
jgi:hypothetical protein